MVATWSRRALLIACVSALAALPGTGVVYTAEMLFRPGYIDSGLLPTIYLNVAVLMFAVSTLVVAVGAKRASAPTKVPAGDTGATDGAAFLRRLPEQLGRDLVCLKMADHYVEAFTTAGSTLVLMRFADAVEELQGADGLRVHRSHWVARRHVVKASRRNGRTVLHMTGRARDSDQSRLPGRCDGGWAGMIWLGTSLAGFRNRADSVHDGRFDHRQSGKILDHRAAVTLRARDLARPRPRAPAAREVETFAGEVEAALRP